MQSPRSCATGKRPLSHYHANKFGADKFTKCQECGYFHEGQQDQPESIPVNGGDLIRAHDVRPLDVIEVGGYPQRVNGFTHSGDGTVTLDLEDASPLTVGENTPIKKVKFAKAEDLEQQNEINMNGRVHDDQLLHTIREAVGKERQRKHMGRVGPDFGIDAFDWMEGAIRMLKNGEWAEQMPSNPMLQDMEVQISELVYQAGKFTEVQNKYAAAISSLESLGYSYPVEGAPQWNPPAGKKTPEGFDMTDARLEVDALADQFLLELGDSGIEISLPAAAEAAKALAALAYEKGAKS